MFGLLDKLSMTISDFSASRPVGSRNYIWVDDRQADISFPAQVTAYEPRGDDTLNQIFSMSVGIKPNTDKDRSYSGSKRLIPISSGDVEAPGLEENNLGLLLDDNEEYTDAYGYFRPLHLERIVAGLKYNINKTNIELSPDGYIDFQVTCPPHGNVVDTPAITGISKLLPLGQGVYTNSLGTTLSVLDLKWKVGDGAFINGVTGNTITGGLPSYTEGEPDDLMIFRLFNDHSTNILRIEWIALLWKLIREEPEE